MKKYSSALVLGLGSSGEAAARLLTREGTRVTVVDGATGSEVLKSAARVRRLGARVMTGVKDLPRGEFEVGVASPGIPPGSEWFRELARRKIDVISELELGWSRCRCPVLAITGSNGKSTLVKLCGDALRLAGRKVELGGNYGTPLSDLSGRSRRLDWLVIEVSSFQLERVREFRPKVGVILNVNPNHLDRHGNMRTYRALKMRLVNRMRTGDTAILPHEQWSTLRKYYRGGGRLLRFGATAGCDYRYAGGKVRHGRRALDFAGTMFSDAVMGVTAAAAAAAVRSCGVDPMRVAEAAGRFKQLPHRMQRVAALDGIKFVDDSKATNLAAMEAGIEMCGGRVLLVAGGILKETNLAGAKKTLAKHVRRAYFIGHSAENMRKAWAATVDCAVSGDLETAVRAAYRDAREGETVLLAPAGTSFDQYGSFEERGEHFADIVKSLKEKR